MTIYTPSNESTAELKFHTKPYDHQREGLVRSVDMRNYALFMEMGTGKSKLFIDTALNLYLRGEIDAVLLFAPKGVYLNWQDIELPVHWPPSVPAMWTYWASLTDKELQKSYRTLEKFQGLRWMLMNIEALAYERPAKFALEFAVKHKGRLLCGIDESTMIKNPTAQRTKNAIYIGQLASHRRIMTGDNAPQAPTDLFSQCQFLGPNMLGIPSFYAFKNRYCILKDQIVRGPNGKERTFKATVGYQRLDELQERLKAFSYRVTKDECLDLPPKVYVTRDVELTKEQKQAYRDLIDNQVTFAGSAPVTVQNPLTLLLRLHQIVCGYLTNDLGEEIDLPNNRLSALMDTVAETSGKIVIWATYRRNIRDIVKALSEEYGSGSVVHFYGETDSDERRFAVNAFQNHNDVRFFVGNPATGRYGLTLTKSHNVIYYSNSYNLEYRTQSEDRVHRIGQGASKVTYVDLMARGTIDTKIVKALREKKNISAMINGDAWKEWIR